MKFKTAHLFFVVRGCAGVCVCCLSEMKLMTNNFSLPFVLVSFCFRLLSARAGNVSASVLKFFHCCVATNKGRGRGKPKEKE